MRRDVRRLELSSVRVCERCGRGRALLVAEEGTVLGIPLDAWRARALAGRRSDDDVVDLERLLLDQLEQTGVVPTEVVFDLDGGVLRALLSLRQGADVVSCTPQEGLGIALRADLKLYATDEALAQAAQRSASRGSETVH